MALPADTVYEVRDTATAGNLNGAGWSEANKGATGIDWTQQDAAKASWTAGGGNNDLACANNTTLTSASGGFLNTYLGNLIHITAGTNFTTGWYCVTGHTDANTVTIDRNPTTGATASAGTGYLGGAASSMNCVGSDPVLPVVADNTIWVKKGSAAYTSAAAPGYSGVSGTATTPIKLYGYDTSRTAVPTGANRPTLALSAQYLYLGNYWDVRNLIGTSAATRTFLFGDLCRVQNCKTSNSNTGFWASVLGAGCDVLDLESDCLKGAAIQLGNYSRLTGGYIHDSETGVICNGVADIVTGTVIDSCKTGVSLAGAYGYLRNLTLRNCVTGISGGTITGWAFSNNLIADNYTGAGWTTNQKSNVWRNNNYYGNTNAPVNVTLDATDLALDPAFTTTLASGTAGTTDGAGTTLTETGAFTGVTTDDCVVIKSGSSGTVTGVFTISSPGANSVVLDRTAGASKTAIVWGVVKGGTTTNLGVGANMAAVGVPSAFPGSSTVSYLDLGAVQRQEPTVPSAANVLDGVAFGIGGTQYTGSLIQGGRGTRSVDLTRETGANARGGSGTCAKLSPTSTTVWGYWNFYVPGTISTQFTLSFYHKITSGFNGLVKVSIFDADEGSALLSSQAVTLTDDAAYHQHTCTAVTPTATGLCRVRIEVQDGSTTGDVYIDDFGIA